MIFKVKDLRKLLHILPKEYDENSLTFCDGEYGHTKIDQIVLGSVEFLLKDDPCSWSWSTNATEGELILGFGCHKGKDFGKSAPITIDVSQTKSSEWLNDLESPELVMLDDEKEIKLRKLVKDRFSIYCCGMCYYRKDYFERIGTSSYPRQKCGHPKASGQGECPILEE